MKPTLVLLAIFGLFALEACTSPRRARSDLPPPPPPPPPAAESAAPAPAAVPAAVVPAPPRSPTPPEPVPTPARATPARTLAFADGMEQLSDADVEGSLERWADGHEIKLEQVVKRVGLYVEVAATIKWDENKKREKDAADYDRIVRESVQVADLLLAAARAAKTDEIKGLSDRLLNTCVECHTKFK